ncbi:hypothetical protein PIROE2DRAFT_64145 [Piromyces sp. E2]|nr:hypothetical protein PIROE2DRAFT_64145 [Piromyces sp. E2]|eukprot:OUM58854.1 hypothetical protein PIROE2DRAFT_64145 [Piromyces sp. E2]
MTDKQIGLWLNDAVNFALNSEIINKNITSNEDINELRVKMADNIYQQLIEADTNNDLVSRSCDVWLVTSCIASFGGILSACGATVVAAIPCALAVVGNFGSCAPCIYEVASKIFN